jgi:hypothetical protein
MARETAARRGSPSPVSPPGDTVWRAIRATCLRLYTVEDEFVRQFREFLTELVPELRQTPDQGVAIAEGLARAVLWAGLTTDPPGVVEETFRNIGAEYSQRGFPASGYHGTATPFSGPHEVQPGH